MAERKKGSDRRGGHGAITLADVAKAASVSEITVSRVIRNTGPISDETRRVVNEAIAATGYIPNLVAGSLASARSQLIGVVLPSIGNIVFPDVLRGISEAISATPFRTVVAVSDYDPEEETRLIGSILSWRPAALILTGIDQAPNALRNLTASRTHVAQIMDIDGEPLNVAIGMSHFRAGAEMARFLLGRGYRRFGFVGHDLSKDTRANKRYMSVRSILAEAGAAYAGEVLARAPSSVEAGRQSLAQLLAQHPDVDAVIFSNDDMAIGGYFHCLAAGIDVPGKLALAGFNGLEIGQALPRPLATIKTRRLELGRMAGQAVLDLIAGREVERVIDVGFEMVPGGTA